MAPSEAVDTDAIVEEEAPLRDNGPSSPAEAGEQLVSLESGDMVALGGETFQTDRRLWGAAGVVESLGGDSLAEPRAMLLLAVAEDEAPAARFWLLATDSCRW